MLLAISSATEAMSIALFDGERLVRQAHEVIGRGHAERLVPLVAELLGPVRPSAILVDCGPGSFTGIRVGIAAANGLAIGWGVPVHGCSGLALVAAGVLRARGMKTIGVAMTGGHGELFVARYGTEPLRRIGALASLTPAAAATGVEDALVVGSGAAQLIAVRGWGEALDALPRAGDANLLPASERSLPVRPLYVRAPDAKPLGSAA